LFRPLGPGGRPRPNAFLSLPAPAAPAWRGAGGCEEGAGGDSEGFSAGSALGPLLRVASGFAKAELN